MYSKEEQSPLKIRITKLKKLSFKTALIKYKRSFLPNYWSRRILFDEYIDSVKFVFDFKGTIDESIKLISKKNRFLFPLVTALSLYEMLKCFYHGIMDNRLHRLLLCDLIWTWSTNFQWLFDLSLGVVFGYTFRYGVWMMMNNNDRGQRQLEWMQFLKLNDETDLIQNYALRKREASDFLRYVNLFVHISQINVMIIYLGCFSIHLKVLVSAFRSLSLIAFIFGTLPNFCSFWIVTLFNYQSLNCFFCIYVLTCIFILKKISSSVSHDLTSNPTDSKKINRLVRFNLKSFSMILQIFASSQKTNNLTLAALFSMVICIGFAFPYLIMNSENLSMFLIYGVMYINAVSITLGCFAKANSLIFEALTIYKKFLFKFIPICSSLRLKLKLELFFNLYQRNNPLSYSHHSLFYYNYVFFVQYLIQSASIVILIYNISN